MITFNTQEEAIHVSGRYSGANVVTCQIGYMILKGKTIFSPSPDACLSCEGDLDVQVDTIETTGSWCTFQGAPQYPYKQIYKDCTFKNQIYLTGLIYKDNVLGGTGSSTKFENCSFYTKASAESVGQLLLLNYPHVNFTPQAANVNIKGIITFNQNPNSLIVFTGEGIVSINGKIMNYGKYQYLVGNEGIAGSWRTKATLSGNVIYEYTADGTNWVIKSTITI